MDRLNSKENKGYQIKLENQFKKCFYYDSLEKYKANLNHPDLIRKTISLLLHLVL